MELTEKRARRSVLTGGLILIALGTLIILSKMDVWRFSQSWPVLLIVIAVGTLVQRVKDIGGGLSAVSGWSFWSRKTWI